MNDLNLHPSNFDSKGFFFFLKFAFILFIIFFVGDMGVKHAFEYFAPSNIASVGTLEVIPHLEPEKPRNLLTRYVASKTIADEVPDAGKFVAVDLTRMKLYLYEHGKLIQELPIVSKGKPGSRWETPTGMYDIKSREINHFSSIGGVFMPYSMQFYGNFFIHGWPYYPDGTSVAKGFSGGCIRLNTVDAKKVYEFVDIKTPIFVYEDGINSENIALAGANFFTGSEFPLIPKPELSAQAFLIGDIDTGEIFLDHNADVKRPIASITKLITALVSNESISYARLIRITAEDLEIPETAGNLQLNEQLSATELLYPLLLESSNDAAHALARSYGYERFIANMNNKARALDMKDTNFSDPSGLSSYNVSTPNDLFTLAQHLFNKQHFVLNTSKLSRKEIAPTDIHPPHIWKNINPFAGHENFIGGKTGFTNAAQGTMISLYEYQSEERKYNLAIIVLGSNNKKKDTINLLEWFKQTVEGTLY